MLHDVIRGLCEAAGWQIPTESPEGVFSFSLAGGEEFSISLPDGERLLFEAPLPRLAAQTAKAEEQAARCLALSAARLSLHTATVAYDTREGRLVLFCRQAARSGHKAVAERLEGFLNELDFWRAQTALFEQGDSTDTRGRAETSGPSSPFSFTPSL